MSGSAVKCKTRVGASQKNLASDHTHVNATFEVSQNIESKGINHLIFAKAKKTQASNTTKKEPKRFACVHNSAHNGICST